MLSGRYPSDEFAELRPRVTWDRVQNTRRRARGREARGDRQRRHDSRPRPLRRVPRRRRSADARRRARRGDGLRDRGRRDVHARRLDLAHRGDHARPRAGLARAGRAGQDAVLARRSGGPPGGARPRDRQAGARAARDTPRRPPIDSPRPSSTISTRRAAENLLRYLDDQAAAGGVPDDRTLVIERCLDELGDWRVCLLSPLGSRIHAPWAMAVTAHDPQPHRHGRRGDVGRRGLRRPLSRSRAAARPAAAAAGRRRGRRRWCCGSSARRRSSPRASARPPRARCCCRAAGPACARRSGSSASAPPICWRWRRASARFRRCSRPTARCCAITSTCRRWSTCCAQVGTRALRVTTIDSKAPSPFAASLLFSYVANYIYDGDAPLAERRAQALSVDQAQLRELLGDAELRELLDPDALDDDRAAAAASRRRLPGAHRRRPARSAAPHRRSDARRDRGAQRRLPDAADGDRRARARAAHRRCCRSPASARYVAVEDVARYRDALGVAAAARAARGAARAGARSGRRSGAALRAIARPVHRARARRALRPGRRRRRVAAAAADRGRPADRGRVPARRHRARVGRRRRAAQPAQPIAGASCGSEIEPVEADALGRFLVAWHGIGSERRGLEALLDAIEQLQGAADPGLGARARDPAGARRRLPAGDARHADGRRRGRLGRRRAARRARRPHRAVSHRSPARACAPPVGRRRRRSTGACRPTCVDYLRAHGASFFAAIHEGTGEGFPHRDRRGAVGARVEGLVTNDTLHPLRAYTRRRREPRAHGGRRRRRSARAAWSPPTAEGRWSLVDDGARPRQPTATEWGAAIAQQLLTRHGIVTRETRAVEAIAGGFSARLSGAARRWRTPAASGAATSSPASAARSSRCRPRSICCARCASRPRTPQRRRAGRHRSRPIPYGTLLSGPTAAGGRRTDADARPTSAAARRAPSARWWCSWTAWPPAICGAASASCCWRCPRPSRAQRASRRRWRAR